MRFVPPHLIDKTTQEHRYMARYGSCPYCDIIREEMRGPRKIFANKFVAVFAPYASLHAYEVCLMPRRHVDNVSELNASEQAAMGAAMKMLLGAVRSLHVPYNFYFHDRTKDDDQHLYMKIAPRGALWAGVEIGTGVIINPVPPEDAAKFYRKFWRQTH